MTDYIWYCCNGTNHLSSPETEQQVKRDLYDLYKPESIIEVREYKSYVLIEELPLEDLFNKP